MNNIIMNEQDKKNGKTNRQVNVVDASKGGTSAIGSDARAVRVDGGTYIEKQVVETKRVPTWAYLLKWRRMPRPVVGDEFA